MKVALVDHLIMSLRFCLQLGQTFFQDVGRHASSRVKRSHPLLQVFVVDGSRPLVRINSVS